MTPEREKEIRGALAIDEADGWSGGWYAEVKELLAALDQAREERDAARRETMRWKLEFRLSGIPKEAHRLTVKDVAAYTYGPAEAARLFPDPKP